MARVAVARADKQERLLAERWFTVATPLNDGCDWWCLSAHLMQSSVWQGIAAPCIDAGPWSVISACRATHRPGNCTASVANRKKKKKKKKKKNRGENKQ
eukprot:NODE_27462_length_513_cov_1.556995.p2 GENE.NODE_27462_length_513_cov_1.556995~~NODE_27462_length_513_cov_1.556995.p2  ORF type:complete len:99 (-),score=20.65 NODE_27462_length_513_cov_1.556995:104-400(-)